MKVVLGSVPSVFLATIAASAASSSPYMKSGVVNCALPGTSISFALNGNGGAIVANASSNYAPFRKAARTKTWSATSIVQEGMKMLVLDNLSGTRIMARIPDGKGMAFIAPKGGKKSDVGVSDILCQILVQPD
jgi:hypothetical protein